MITETVIQATPREEKGKNASRRARAAGLLPAAVYGDGKDAVTVTVVAREIGAILRSESGRNSIFTLDIQSHDSSPVMIKHMDVDPVTSRVLHMDLVRISMTEKTRVSVRLELEGEPVGVKLGGGMMDVHLHAIEVECLPRDIPEAIRADISHLDLGEHFRVGDIKADLEGVEIVTDADALVATVLATHAEKPAAEEPAAEGGAAS